MFSTRSRRPAPSKLLSVLLLAPAALALAACDDSSTEPEEDQLAQGEANALVEGLYGGTLLAYGETLLQSDPAMLQNIPPGAPIPLSATTPCIGGGAAVFTGNATLSIDETQGSLGLEMSGMLAANGCTFTGGGTSFVLDSSPGLAQTGTITIAPDFSLLVNFASSGSFNWTSGTRSGSCELDNAITAEISMADVAGGMIPTAMVTGSVCGLTVNREIALLVTTS